LLAQYDVFSTQADRISGHFAVLRNTPELRRAFQRIPDHKSLIEKPYYAGMDEGPFGTSLKPRTGLRRIFHALEPRPPRALFIERYSMVLSKRGWHDGTMNYPQRWFLETRALNERSGRRS